jgi:hypothetical protein
LNKHKNDGQEYLRLKLQWPVHKCSGLHFPSVLARRECLMEALCGNSSRPGAKPNIIRLRVVAVVQRTAADVERFLRDAIDDGGGGASCLMDGRTCT